MTHVDPKRKMSGVNDARRWQPAGEMACMRRSATLPVAVTLRILLNRDAMRELLFRQALGNREIRVFLVVNASAVLQFGP